MRNLLSDAICRVVDWAYRKRHLHRVSGYGGISSRAAIGLGTKLIGPKENFIVGDYSYINVAHLSCGIHSKITIGSGCAVGYNVAIKAITHSMEKPTNNVSGSIIHQERDITIGDNCWIGDNVFIKDGVTLGDNVVVGANSVVTHSFQDDAIIAGVPARVIGERKK